ncbi:hypothetical protein DL769_010578 [Monosporascus sp. CRB-8-3]|nr:hypothetical protein DL769_010578 [Monosporascus sp. CRB-8-3]
MPPLARDIEAELQEHSDLLDELIRKYEQQQNGVQVNLKEAEDKTRDVLEKHDALEEGYRQRRMALRRQVTAARQLVASVKASDESIDADALLAEVELARQATFDHALLVVAAGEGSLDRIRNISDDHRKALGIVEAEKAKADLLKTVGARDSTIRLLESAMKEKDDDLRSKDEELKRTRDELESLKNELGQANQRLDEELRTSESLRGDVDAALAERGRAEAAELGLAEFFAVQSGWNGPSFQSWAPFVRAVSRADYVAGLPASAARPWTVLQSWCEGGDRLHDYPPAGLAHAAGRLYGAALNDDWGEESLSLVGLVMGHLVRDEIVSLLPVVAALEVYFDVASRIDLARCDPHIRVLYLGIWQVASVVRSLQPGVERVDKIARDIESLVDGDFPYRELRELMRDPEVAETELRDRPLSQNRLFIGDRRIVLLAVSGVPGWLFAVDFGERSVGMVHVSRGEWVGMREYRIKAPEGGRDLTVPVTSAQGLNWILSHFYP